MRNLTRDEARDRAALLHVDYYDVRLTLTSDNSFLSSCEIHFSCRTPGASTFLELDGELLDGDLDGRPLVHAGNRIALTDLQAENVVRIRARCATTDSGEGLHRAVDPADGAVYLYAQAFLDDAQRIFACFDQPDLKATFRTTVAAPQGWTVRANTRAQLDGGRHVFAATERMSTYLWTVAAGPWHGVTQMHEGVELGVWCRASLAPHLEVDELLHITRQCLVFQQGVFGRPYPFGDSYDQVFVPEFNAGAMENPGMVTFSDDSFLFRSRVTQGRRRLRAQVIAHEMAHMWFGDLVTMRWWDDLWLNESFAEFLGVHTVEQATDYDGAWADFCLGRKAWGYRADQLPTTHPVAGDVPDNRTALLNFDGISYAKGASALRQLAAWLGEEVFFAGIRRYLERHAWGNTCLADLLTALEEASGRDLQQWAQLWLRTPGVPLLRLEGGPAGDSVSGGSVSGDGVLVQEPPAGHGGLRPHRVGVGLYDSVDGGALLLRERLVVDVVGARTPLPGRAPADLVLPNDGDLTFAKVRLDARSLRTVLSGVGRLADPLARAVCWGALWDAARDGELPAAEFIGAVLRGVPAEPDPEQVETLLGRARQAALLFAVDGPVLLARLHEAQVRAAGAAEPGADLQLVLVRAAIDAATEPALPAAWLAGVQLPIGLVVDADLRWQLLRRLAALGAVGEDRLAEELAADRTAAGEQQAAWALAARPEAPAKQAAWEELFGAGPLTNARARALAGGFWQPGQDELLRPWVARYVEQAPRLWERRSPQLATSIARLTFPATLVEPGVLDATEPLVAAGLPVELRRTVLEQRDDLARALRARAHDGRA